MQKKVLIAERQNPYRKKLADLIRTVQRDVTVWEACDTEQAYRYAMEHTIDVFIVGVVGGQRADVPEYRFISGLRDIHRYMFAPVILISDMEDESGYAFHTLHCYDCVARMYDLQYMQKLIAQALLHTTERISVSRLFLKKNNIVYPVMCSHIIFAQVTGKMMHIYMQNEKKHEVPYLTIRQMLSDADCPYLIQCARDTVVNMQMISAVDMSNRYITMNTGHMLDIGGKFLKRFRKELLK